MQPIVELPTGKNPDALLYDEFSGRVFVFNHSDVTTTAIDIAEGKVVGTVDVGGSALEAGATDGKGTIFVNLEDANEIVSFDAKTLVVKNRWKISPGEEPTGLALDTKTKRLFSVCHNGLMMVVDSEKGNIVAQVPIGKRVDGAWRTECAVERMGYCLWNAARKSAGQLKGSDDRFYRAYGHFAGGFGRQRQCDHSQKLSGRRHRFAQ